MKNRKPQRILAWDEDRAAFKKRVTELLEPLKQELGIEFEFGRIDEVDTKYGFEATAKMKCYFSKLKPGALSLQQCIDEQKNPNPDGGGYIPPMSEADLDLWANNVLPRLRAANPTPIKARFLGKNGYPYELNRAEEVFNTNDEYEIVGGVVNSSSSYYEFKGIRGQWNTVMFSGHWEQAQHLMEHNYL